MKSARVLAILLALIIPCAIDAAETTIPQQYSISVTLKELPADGSKQKGKVLAELGAVALASRPVNMHVGGKVTLGASEVPIGPQLSVRMTPKSATTVHVVGVLVVSTAGTPENGIVARDSSEVHIDTVVELGKKIHTRIDKSKDKERRFELLVEDPSRIQAANVSASSSSRLQ